MKWCVPCALVVSGSFVVGCATSPDAPASREGIATARMEPLDLERTPRAVVIRCGRTGAPLTFEGVIDRALEADAVMLGERHDDGVAHAVQREIVAAIAERDAPFALAMEMLERDEQVIVDDFLEGIIDQPTFVRLTHSASWAGEGSWDRWYQPVIDVARAAGAPVIAANAPRRYVRLARLEGYERLAELPAERRAFVAWPETLDESGYRDRFFEFMGADDPENERALSFFRSQMAWDATMADSVARALDRGLRPVVLLLGQFHSDFEGGTILELRWRYPGVRVLNISLQPFSSDVLREEDEGRADIVIYTR